MSERQLERALEAVFCPEAETLAQFLDETLDSSLQERVAGHVLRCEACQDVVAWTREAAAQAASRPKVRGKKGTGRHRRRSGAARAIPARTGVPSWVPAVAAAAGVLLVALIGLKASDTGSGSQLGQASPSPSKIQPPETPRETPSPSATRETPAPSPTSAASPQPSEQPSPSERPSPSEQPSPSTSPGDTRVEPAAEPSRVWVAALEPGVTWREEGGKRRALKGGQALLTGTKLEAQSPAAVQVGDQRVELGAKSALGLVKAGVQPLSGEALVSGRGQIACGEVRLESAKDDEVFVAQHRGAMVLVIVAGAPKGPLGALKPGQAFRVAGGALEPAPKAGELLRRAEVFSSQRRQQASLAVPGGLALRAALVVAGPRLEKGSLAQRAQAARVVEACWAAAPRLAAETLSSLEVAHEELAALAPSALIAERAGADYALAAVARARRTKSTETSRAALNALAGALREDPRSLRDPDALLALRALERVTKSKDGAFWRRAAESLRGQAPSGPGAPLLIALVGGPKAAKASLKALDVQLESDPLTTPLTPEVLWGAAQRLILAGAWSPERSRRLRGHLEVHLSQALAPELAYVAGRHATRVLGGKIRAGVEDRRRALPVAGGYRVTLVFSSPRKPRTVHLCGSWNDWEEETTPMTRRRDGAFEVTLELPPGRHEYKLRLDGGRLWEIDADNALVTADTRGGKNSVLLLP